MLPPDDEIRKMIRVFREKYPLLEYCRVCPFPSSSIDKPANCPICYYIMNTMPHIPGLQLLGMTNYISYQPCYMPCPCVLYGAEYTSQKIAQFMGEL